MKIPFRIIKISGILLVAIATFITATALFLPYLLDVNAYRSEIISALQNGFNRQISFKSGKFAWHFGPSFDFTSFAVKEPDGKTDFVSANRITVQIALIPLLEKRVELKNLIIDGATISLQRGPDGKLNIDDLVKPGSSDVSVKFKKVHIHNSTVLWRDSAGRDLPLQASLKNISFSADHLARGRKGRIKFSAELPAASGAPTSIELSGTLKIPAAGVSLLESFADGDITVKKAEISRFWSYFGSYIPFDDCGGRVDFSTSVKGSLQDFSTKGKIAITGAAVVWPGVFRATLAPKLLQLEFTGAMNKQHIDISSLDISMEGFRIKGSFQMQDYRGKDPRIVAKAITPSTFRYEDIRDYVPYGIIDSDTSDYIENKIKSGIFKLETGVLDGRISQIKHMEKEPNQNTLMIRGPVEKAVLSYGPKAPTFNNLKGVIELKGKNFNLVGMTGNFGTSPFSLNGSITEYNTDKPSDYPITMNISPNPPEMAWLANIAGIPMLEYRSSTALRLTGSGHYSAYKLNGDWDLKNASYTLPGYVNKPQAMPNTLKFSTVIGKESTKVTAVNYNLLPLVITGSGLIGYGEKPYLGFDLQTNRFTLTETLPILSMWRKYNLKGTAQARIKGGGDPADLSAMDYYGTVDITRLSILPDEHLKQISGISGVITFKGNSLETNTIAARYGSSTVNIKAAIKSLKNPEGHITLSSPHLFLKDIDLSGKPDSGIKRFSANGLIKKDSVAINSASGLVNDSNFNVSGVLQTVSNRQSTFTVTSSKLDLDDLRIFSPKEQKTTSHKTPGQDIKLTVNADAGNFGSMTFNKLNAVATQENGIIYLQGLSAAMLGGKFTAKGRISPGGEQGDRYDLTVNITNADADKLFDALDISREVTGRLSLHGDLTARGVTLKEVKKSALGNIRISMSDGKLRKFNTLSKVFSILNVSQLLKFRLPDMVSGGMPYSTIKGSFAVKDGIASTSDLFIGSNAINISIIGSTDIVKEELNFTIGAQPLQTVDKIINRIPIVGWILTGKDNDLLTAYFEAKGTWADPHVNAIPVKSLGKGVLNIFIRIFELPVRLITDTGEVILGQ